MKLSICLICLAMCFVIFGFGLRSKTITESDNLNQSVAIPIPVEREPNKYLYPKTSGEIDLGQTDPKPATKHVVLGDLPAKVDAMTYVLRCLNQTTLRTFESAPKFGIGRANLGPRIATPAKPEAEHAPLPAQDHDWPPRTLDDKFAGKYTPYGKSWMWFKEMRGLTSRGFVYRIRDSETPWRDDLDEDERHRMYEDLEYAGFFVVSLPSDEDPKRFLRRVGSLRGSALVNQRERLWDVERLQLVSLLKNDPPAVYETRRIMVASDEDELPKRSLDEIETKSLNELRAGTDCVIAWDTDHERIQMLGAIRAKSDCLKCHAVEQGELLGAFTYWITRIKQP